MNVAIICLPTKTTIEVCVVDIHEVLWRESLDKHERSMLPLVFNEARQWAEQSGLTVISQTRLASRYGEEL